jgi:FkbM family methyltransferase
MVRLPGAAKRLATLALPDAIVNTLKKYYYRRLFLRSNDRDPEMAVLPFLVSPGDVVMDLGASIGLYTKKLAQLVGPAGRVIAIEPAPPTFAFLRGNVEALGLGNVTLVEAAASATDGTAVIEVPRYASGVENFYTARVIRTPGTGLRTFDVTAITIDSIAPAGVSFIKCDVERHEKEVLKGARRTIERGRPAWCLEVSSPETLELMSSFGYQLFFWKDGHLHSQHRDDLVIRADNYFCLMEKQLEKVIALHLPLAVTRPNDGDGSVSPRLS